MSACLSEVTWSFSDAVDPAIPFIKRIVGLPGDVVEYRNKTLYLNGNVVEQTKVKPIWEPVPVATLPVRYTCERHCQALSTTS